MDMQAKVATLALACSSAQAAVAVGSSAQAARSAPDRPVVATSAPVGSSAQAARSAPDRPVVVAVAQVGSSARAAVAVGSSAPVVVARAAMAYPLAPAPVVAYPLAPAPAVLVYLLVQDKSVASSVQVVEVARVMVRVVSFLLALALGWRSPAPSQKVVWPLLYYSELQWERLLDEATLVTDKGPEIMFLIGSSARLAVAEYTVSTRLSLPLLLLSLSIE